MTLVASQVAALRDIEQVWPGAKVVIIGATALGFYFDMRWRKTADVDLAVALDLNGLSELTKRPGWTRHPSKEHEFTSPGGAKVDLLPAGPALLAAGRLRWQNGDSMSLAGMELAFQHAEPHAAGGHNVLVAPPAVVAILKMVSFADRPTERERDLEDIGHLLDAYVDDDSERRWDEAADCGEFDLAPAYLLGIDIARLLATEAHRAIVNSFLRRVEDPESPTHALMLRLGPGRWSSDASALARRLSAFKAGMLRASSA
jgi:predicted nucleotidyltransferase